MARSYKLISACATRGRNNPVRRPAANAPLAPAARRAYIARAFSTSSNMPSRFRKGPASEGAYSFLGNRMANIAALTGLIEPEARALGLALVRVKMFGGTTDPTLQVMAERPDTRQLTIDDCAALSRRISDVLDDLEASGKDPMDHAYRLEVSSPGIDRPLTRLQDFDDWKGHEARINLAEKLDGRKQFKGDLTGVEPKGSAVGIVDAQGVQYFVPFDLIDDAKLAMTDRLIAATAPLSSDGADEFEAEEQD
jgi:ribosome maturation factor RimP